MHSSRTTLDEKKFNLYKNISGKNFKGNLGLNLKEFFGWWRGCEDKKEL